MIRRRISFDDLSRSLGRVVLQDIRYVTTPPQLCWHTLFPNLGSTKKGTGAAGCAWERLALLDSDSDEPVPRTAAAMSPGSRQSRAARSLPGPATPLFASLVSTASSTTISMASSIRSSVSRMTISTASSTIRYLLEPLRVRFTSSSSR